MVEVRFKLSEADGMIYELFQLINKKSRNEFVKECIINSFRGIRDKQFESNFITVETLKEHGFKCNTNNNITLGVEDLFNLIQKTTSTSQPVTQAQAQTQAKEVTTLVQTIDTNDKNDEPFFNSLDCSIDVGF